MRQRTVVFAPEAVDDLVILYDWIAGKAGVAVAIGYIDRNEAFCAKLDMTSMRGTARDDIRAGLRVVGFERRIAIAFAVSGDNVQILRIFYGGADWESSL